MAPLAPRAAALSLLLAAARVMPAAACTGAIGTPALFSPPLGGTLDPQAYTVVRRARTRARGA